jgi:para-aminobenzoate synthetase/4-amino-4-deoxychorismate lyase
MTGYYQLPQLNYAEVKKQDYFLLFETTLFDRDNFMSYIFIAPKALIKVNYYRDISEAFRDIQDYSRRYYLAGYFSYELGYYFESPSFENKGYSAFPLIHLGVFERAITFNHKNGRWSWHQRRLFSDQEDSRQFKISNIKFNFKENEYVRKISRIKKHIERGDTYQVNFTGKYSFNFSGCPFLLYQDLKSRQAVRYGSFCKFKDEYTISLSPELFFKRNDRFIYSSPMKGTAARGMDIREDREIIERLRNDLKSRAENLMIVDLIRNDLGRICEAGSVKVSRLFNIEKYKTIFQMTSLIQGILRKDIGYFDIFRNIFPGGSVTGAPKIKTMQIIKQLEKGCRNIYCGALGIIFPRKKAVFNLPIRTISLIRNRGEMGIGGGILYDSLPRQEFQECLLKARFLTNRYQPFKLLETILWDGNYRFLREHLRRMRESSRYFDFQFNYQEIISSLQLLKNKFKKAAAYKVRILLDESGKLDTEYSEISPENLGQQRYIAVSRHRIDPGEVFCYHKTTNRKLYDSQYRYYRARGYFDVIFLNIKGEVTEGSISNIIIEVNNKYYTPPVSCGLLPGIFRDFFIKRYKASEKRLFLEDLVRADKIFLCNSVRGMVEVRIKKESCSES